MTDPVGTGHPPFPRDDTEQLTDGRFVLADRATCGEVETRCSGRGHQDP